MRVLIARDQPERHTRCGAAQRESHARNRIVEDAGRIWSGKKVLDQGGESASGHERHSHEGYERRE
jgi:hypothetical protein